MTQLIIDQGNTRAKVAIFSEKQLEKVVHLSELCFGELEVFLQNGNWEPQGCILSSTKELKPLLLKQLSALCPNFIHLSHSTPVPLTILYKTPKTLGRDRLAGVIGANTLFPDKDVLVIDAGTAITYDMVTKDRKYLGGNISPGLQMRSKALHHFTDKLPLVTPYDQMNLLGKDTNSAINAGIIQGIIFEMEGYISHLTKDFPDLTVILTGGDTKFFDKKLKNSIFAEPDVVLFGLNRILEYNA